MAEEKPFWFVGLTSTEHAKGLKIIRAGKSNKLKDH